MTGPIVGNTVDDRTGCTFRPAPHLPRCGAPPVAHLVLNLASPLRTSLIPCHTHLTIARTAAELTGGPLSEHEYAAACAHPNSVWAVTVAGTSECRVPAGVGPW